MNKVFSISFVSFRICGSGFLKPEEKDVTKSLRYLDGYYDSANDVVLEKEGLLDEIEDSSSSLTVGSPQKSSLQ